MIKNFRKYKYIMNNWIIRIQDGRHFFSYANNGIWDATSNKIVDNS